jgi:hypothetical protein
MSINTAAVISASGQPKQARRARILNNTDKKVTYVVEFRENRETYENVAPGKY